MCIITLKCNKLIQLLEWLVKSGVLKWLQKWSATSKAFTLVWRINFNMQTRSEALRQNFEHFLLLSRFLRLSLNENLMLLNFLSHFFYLVPCIYVGILGFKREL